ncbi:TetR/AcrR family transcriptional regulator [Rhodococcus sp. ARC_M5]|uniref:TetR/AcrR family transcriptional regulator n=1 Tax=Rhodococcus sp. ARC_M5 TaxID=2928851 RepID=UPI001FB40FCC|nr:TetR/AcrR family transcriptional regulator [Rhodococcus sp. ARC_M5]MCJ0892134.1 TetR family transcriptional regulator [Rhodococcus sp. ARC_M5]
MPSNDVDDAEQSRRARPRRDRRQALIDAAIELISEGASADISAAAISRRAGVAHGLLFYYFTDKQGLVEAALADVLGRLADAQGPQPEEHAVRTRLEGFVRRHIEFLRDHRALYLRVVREEEFGEAGVESALRQARAEGERQVAALAELPDPLSPLVVAAISGWTGFLDRTAEAFFDTPDIELDALVALIVDAFEAVVESATRRSE